MREVGIGLLGLGTVGSGVARLLDGAAQRISARVGARLVIKRALVRDRHRPRDVSLEPERLTTDVGVLLDDPEIAVVVEAIGGTEPALAFVMRALEAGKDVVTANKAILAEHGPEIFDQARRFDRAVAFEASVGGGIPIVQALGVSLAANRIQGLAAIVNGTCNFILSSMAESGISYELAMRKARELGYAEPDPTLDVDGTDTAHKLAVLAQVAFVLA